MYHHHQCENHLCLLLLLRLFLSLIIMYGLVQLVSLVNYVCACVRAKKALRCTSMNKASLFAMYNKWKRQLIFPLPFVRMFEIKFLLIQSDMSLYACYSCKNMFNLIRNYLFVPYENRTISGNIFTKFLLNRIFIFSVRKHNAKIF